MDAEDFAEVAKEADQEIASLGASASHVNGLMTGLVRFRAEGQDEAVRDVARIASVVVIAKGLLATARTAKMLLEDSLE